uniref:Glucose-1-phosphate adenylyltransferase n=1 Tax=Opuntia streptacantha TaxID=393608 RepID=A0A7C8YJ33_OPUST
MESCCATLGTNTLLVRAGKSGFRDWENGFWGERVRANFNCNVLVNMAPKSQKSDQRGRKFKPGVAVSVLTSNNPTETLITDAPIYERRRADGKKVAAVILGGGAGTQLFPLTSRAATPAVPVGGCYRLVDIPMSNCINSGINKICILTQYNSASLNRHIYRTYHGNGNKFGDGFVEVLAAMQTQGEAGNKWFQGTADAVRHFLWMFEIYAQDPRNKDIENILILSGDQLYRMDYMDLVQNHVDRNSDITISCAPVGESRASDFGLVKIDSNGRVVQFLEKPRGPDLETMRFDTQVLGLSPEDAMRNPYIASMGIYVFKRDLLLEMLTQTYATANDFGSEILPSAVKERNIQAYLFRDYWEDIGTLKSFYEANLALTEEFPKFEFYDPKTPIYTSPRFLPPTKMDNCKIKDAIISHGCFLRECTVVHSIVGERSRLDSGVELKDTLVMGADNYQTESEIASLLAEGKIPIGIGRNTKIRNAIIDKNAKIGKDVIITNKDVSNSVSLLDSFAHSFFR